MKPHTALGKMMSYYLKMEPHLFKAALEDQLRRLKEEKDKQQEQSELQVTDSKEVVLYRWGAARAAGSAGSCPPPGRRARQHAALSQALPCSCGWLL